MEPTQVIQKPIVTEKSTWGQLHGQYRFRVHPHATKPQIKRAIEALYSVKVAAVNTQVRKGEFFRNRFGVSKRSDRKVAIVTLEGDDRIELY